MMVLAVDLNCLYEASSHARCSPDKNAGLYATKPRTLIQESQTTPGWCQIQFMTLGDVWYQSAYKTYAQLSTMIKRHYLAQATTSYLVK